MGSITMVWEFYRNLLPPPPLQIDLRDKYGDTPLHVACKSGREAIVELLLEIGADPLLENKHGKTPFQWATDFGQVYVYIIRIMMY